MLESQGWKDAQVATGGSRPTFLVYVRRRSFRVPRHVFGVEGARGTTRTILISRSVSTDLPVAACRGQRSSAFHEGMGTIFETKETRTCALLGIGEKLGACNVPAIGRIRSARRTSRRTVRPRVRRSPGFPTQNRGPRHAGSFLVVHEAFFRRDGCVPLRKGSLPFRLRRLPPLYELSFPSAPSFDNRLLRAPIDPDLLAPLCCRAPTTGLAGGSGSFRRLSSSFW